MNPGPSTRLRGIVLATTGTACLVPDATLVRLVDAPDLDIVVWRTLCIAVVVGVVVLVRHGRSAPAAFVGIGPTGLAVGVLWGLGLVLFVFAVNHTAVANALVILATAPLFAVAFSRLLMREAVATRTWVALFAALGGVALTFASGLRVGGTGGNLAALGVAAGVGLNLTLLRRAAAVEMLPAVSLAGVVGTAVALPLAWPLELRAGDAVPLVLMGLLVPAALVLLTAGTRHLPSPEVGLLMLLEPVFGPLLAWLVIAEAPPVFAAAGGGVVVVTLAAHSLVSLRAEPQPALGGMRR